MCLVVPVATLPAVTGVSFIRRSRPQFWCDPLDEVGSPVGPHPPALESFLENLI